MCLPCVFIDDVQCPIGSPVSSAILDEVIGPDMVRTFRLEAHARTIVQPELPLLFCFCGTFSPSRRRSTRLWFTCQPALFGKPVHAITIAAIFVGQFYDIVSQPLFISTALRNLSLCRTVLPQGAAGTTLRHIQLLPYMIDALATTRKAQKFPLAASVNMSLSNVRSDTARRNRWFTFSSSFRRFS